jgi:hypothetical protein
MGNIGGTPGNEIIQANNLMAFRQQAIAKVRTQKPRRSCN